MALNYKAKRKPVYLQPGLSLDWPIAAACIVGGLITMRIASNADTWNRLVEKGEERATVGSVVPKEGRVRLKRAGSSTWQDLSDTRTVSEGDTVATGQDGLALLRLGGMQVKVLQDSLIVVRADKPKGGNTKDPSADWWNALAEPEAPPPVLEVKKGNINLAVTPGSKNVKLVSKGKVLNLDGSGGGGELNVAIDPNSSGLVMSASQGSQFKVGEDGKRGGASLKGGQAVAVDGASSGVSLKKAAPIPKPTPKLNEKEIAAFAPDVLGPLPGSRFVAPEKHQAVPIVLRWRPVPPVLATDVEVKKLGDVVLPLKTAGSSSGVRVELEPGRYMWRVRTKNLTTNQVSDWTQPSEVVVQDRETVLAEQEHQKQLAEQKELERKKKEAELARARELEAQREKQRQAELARAAEESKKRAVEEAKERARQAELAKAAEEERRKKYEAVIAAARSRIDVMDPNPDKIGAASAGQLAEASSIGGGPARASTALSNNSRSLELDKLRVRLEWRAIRSATEYQITIFQNGSATVTEKIRDPSYDLVLKSFDPNIKFSYQVSAVLASGKKISSDITPIGIEVAPPKPVEPPEASVLDVKEPIQFTWAKTVLTDSYDFQLAKDPDFTALLENQKIRDNVTLVRVGQSGTFYWRVRGTTRSFLSGWSPVRKLITK